MTMGRRALQCALLFAAAGLPLMAQGFTGAWTLNGASITSDFTEMNIPKAASPVLSAEPAADRYISFNWAAHYGSNTVASYSGSYSTLISHSSPFQLSVLPWHPGSILGLRLNVSDPFATVDDKVGKINFDHFTISHFSATAVPWDPAFAVLGGIGFMLLPTLRRIAGKGRSARRA